MMTFEDGAFHLLRTPRLGVNVNGAGDAIAALFLFHRLRTGSAVAALEAAGSSVYGLLRQDGGGGFAGDPDRRGAGGIRDAERSVSRDSV